MNRTDIKDEIDRIKNITWSNSLKVCELQHYFTGTFCFPLGPEFGCGGSINITEGQSFTLSGKFGLKGAEVGTSATFTSSTAWSKTSEPCEWCEPEICYIDSVLEVWECESFLDWYSWKSEFKRFTPGRARIYPNCKTDNEKCDCNSETTALQQSNALVFIDNTNQQKLTSMVRTTEFRKKYGTKPSNPKEDVKTASALVESLFSGPGKNCEQDVDLFVELPKAKNHRLNGANSNEGLVLLSKENCSAKNNSISIQKNNLLPVLAVGPFVKNPDARIKLIRNNNNEEVILLEEEGLVEVGKLSTIWKEIQIPPVEIAPGEYLKLLVELVDSEGQIRASLCERVKMPHFLQV